MRTRLLSTDKVFFVRVLQELSDISKYFHVGHLMDLFKPLGGVDDVVGDIPEECVIEKLDERFDQNNMKEKATTTAKGDHLGCPPGKITYSTFALKAFKLGHCFKETLI